MSSVCLNASASALEQLRTINAMAQSKSGSSSGRIGLVNVNGQARVIKFNTHLGERLFGAAKTSDMQTSCDFLRANICALLDDSVGKIDQKLCEKLKASINKGKSKNLLDRSIVASVIKDVEKAANTNRKEWEQAISLDGTEYDMYNSDSTGRDTDFDTVRNRVSEEGTAAAETEKTAPSAPGAGKEANEVNVELATVKFDESKIAKLPDNADDTVKKNTRKHNLESLGRQLAASFKEVKNPEVKAAIKANPNKIDLNLKHTDDYVIEDVNDTRNASRGGGIEIAAGQTSDIAQKYGDGTLILAYGDSTDFGCGIDKGWVSQEENQFDVCNPDYFRQIVADDDAVEERHKEGDNDDERRWKYRDDVERPLDPTTGYIINQEIVRDGYGVALPEEKRKKIDLQMAAFPSFRTETSEDPRGVLKFLCKCRGIPSVPLTPQLKNAQKFIDAVIEKANELYEDSDGLDHPVLTGEQKKELMKLVMFSGDNDVFKIFSDDTAGEVDKLIDYVRANKHKAPGAGNMSLLDKAQANYKSTMVKVVSGWVSAARQRGVKNFLGGPIGCGEFANKYEDVGEIFGEAFAKHGGDMKFVYCQFGVDPNAEPNTDTLKFMNAFNGKFKEVQDRMAKRPVRGAREQPSQVEQNPQPMVAPTVVKHEEFDRNNPNGMYSLGNRIQSAKDEVLRVLEDTIEAVERKLKEKNVPKDWPDYRAEVRKIFDDARALAAGYKTSYQKSEEGQYVQSAPSLSFIDVAYNGENVDRNTISDSDRLNFLRLVDQLRNTVGPRIHDLIEEMEDEINNHEGVDDQEFISRWGGVIEQLDKDLAGGIASGGEAKKAFKSFFVAHNEGEKIISREEKILYKADKLRDLGKRMIESTLPTMIKRYKKIVETARGFDGLNEKAQNALKADLTKYINDYKLVVKDYGVLATAKKNFQLAGMTVKVAGRKVDVWDTVYALARELPDPRNPAPDKAWELHQHLPKSFFGDGYGSESYQSIVHRDKDGKKLKDRYIERARFASGKLVMDTSNRMQSPWQDYDRTTDEVKALGADESSEMKELKDTSVETVDTGRPSQK